MTADDILNCVAAADAEPLLAERQRLLDAHFDGTATPEQERCRQQVCWALDHIENERLKAAGSPLAA